MACAFPDDTDEASHLTDCGICLSEITKPKTLPCLHSFCLECLRMYASAEPQAQAIKCPLCQEKIDLPADGVDGFRDNFLINQVKEHRVIFNTGDVKMTCTCCGATERKMVAHCVNCKGFLCQNCLDFHKNLGPLKDHTVFTFQELQSGKVDINSIRTEECCPTHKDQVLRWFCKTCGVEICRDCTVMDHCRPEHDYATLESVTEGQMNEIKTLIANCTGISQQINAALTDAEKVKKELKEKLAGARTQLDEARIKILEALEKNYKLSTDKLNEIEQDRSNEIDSKRKDLQNFQSKVNNAMELATLVIKSGSHHDVASNYSSLTTTLTQIKDIPIRNVCSSLSSVLFRPNQKGMVTSVDLGSVVAGNPRGRDDKLNVQEEIGKGGVGKSMERNGKWLMEKEIGKDGKGKLVYGVGVASSPKGDIVVTDYDAKNVKMFDADGKFKQLFDQGNLKLPHDVTVSASGQYYVTDKSVNVKVYSSDGKYLKQFPAMSPDGVSSVADDSKLIGLSIDNTGHLWVGKIMKIGSLYRGAKQYISKHMPDGTHISSIKVNITPLFIQVTSQRVIVSPGDHNTDVHILDHTGNVLHTINKPTDANSWWPTGVCSNDDGIIYISSSNMDNTYGIYSFTMDGEYIECITKDVTCAHGLALIDDNKLIVAQGRRHPAKIFTFKK